MVTDRAPSLESPAAVTEAPARVLRNAAGARRLHTAVFLTAAFLLVSGLALLWEVSAIQDLLGGHVAAGRWHRWVGIGLVITLGLLVPVLRLRATWRFMWESVRFRWADLRWFRSYPRFVARPLSHELPRHEGHFDPGQRVLNVAFLGAFLALSVTGLLMAFPDRFQPFVFAWSLRVHRIAVWLFVALAAAHILVASGLLPAYRGVWRAMHGSGRVDRRLAQRLWPRWVEREEADGGLAREASIRTGLTPRDGRYAPNPTNRPLRTDHSDTPG